jgi:3-dehydro-L-gulonate 2-dehydrogenase
MFGSEEEIEKILNSSVEQIHSSIPVREGTKVTYPGERTLATRRENMELGVPVDEAVWEDVCKLA